MSHQKGGPLGPSLRGFSLGYMKQDIKCRRFVLTAVILVMGAFGVECAPKAPLNVPDTQVVQSVDGDDAPDIGEALHLIKRPSSSSRASLGISRAAQPITGQRQLKFTGGCSETDGSVYAVLECTNAVRTDPDAFANDYPCYYNSWRNEAVGKQLGPLDMDGTLLQMAQLHTDDQARINEMSHTGSDGSSLSIRANRINYQWSSLGENVAVGFDSAKSVVMAWMCSEGHRKNLLSCTFDTIGIGTAQSVTGRRYYTQNFGCGLGRSCACSGSSTSGLPGTGFSSSTSSFFQSPSSFDGNGGTDFPGFPTTNSPIPLTPTPSPPVPSPPWWTTQFFSPFNEEPAESPTVDPLQSDPVVSVPTLTVDTAAQAVPVEPSPVPAELPDPEPNTYDSVLNPGFQTATVPKDVTSQAVESSVPILPTPEPVQVSPDASQPGNGIPTQLQSDPLSNTDPAASQQWRWSCDWVGPNWSCERVLESSRQPSTTTDSLRSSTEVFTIGK